MITCRPSSSVRRLASVVRPSTPFNVFSSVIPGPIFKLHMESSVEGGLKIYTNGYGPLIKMVALPIYGKNT